MSPGNAINGLTEFSARIRLLIVLLSSSVHIRLWRESKDQKPEASSGASFCLMICFLFDDLRLAKAAWPSGCSRQPDPGRPDQGNLTRAT
jgi:hypothetical protein